MTDVDDAETRSGSSSRAALLPLAPVTKILKECVHDGMTIAPDAPLLLQHCMQEFLQMVTSQSNSHATTDRKNTISDQHISTALCELGVGHYRTTGMTDGTVGAIDRGSYSCMGASGIAASATAAPERKRTTKIKRSSASGLSEEELLRMQQELFASARNRMRGELLPD